MVLSNLISLLLTLSNSTSSTRSITRTFRSLILSPIHLSFLSLNSIVNHTPFQENILDFLLCLPSTLSLGFTTSQVNFNSLQSKVAKEKHTTMITCLTLKT